VPVVCLASAILIGGSLMAVGGIMKSSDVYVGALARVRSSPAVTEALGSPLKEGLVVTGNIFVSGSSGKADLATTVSGPKGSGAVYLVASKALGTWHFDRLVVQLDQTGQRIDLSDNAGRPQPPPESARKAKL